MPAISWREQVDIPWDDDEVRFVLDQQASTTLKARTNTPSMLLRDYMAVEFTSTYIINAVELETRRWHGELNTLYVIEVMYLL